MTRLIPTCRPGAERRTRGPARGSTGRWSRASFGRRGRGRELRRPGQARRPPHVMPGEAQLVTQCQSHGTGTHGETHMGRPSPLCLLLSAHRAAVAGKPAFAVWACPPGQPAGAEPDSGIVPPAPFAKHAPCWPLSMLREELRGLHPSSAPEPCDLRQDREHPAISSGTVARA